MIHETTALKVECAAVFLLPCVFSLDAKISPSFCMISSFASTRSSCAALSLPAYIPSPSLSSPEAS